MVGAAANELFPKVKRIQVSGGAVPSPFDCWLVLRGIRTLPYRMRAHSENGAKVAAFLSRHSGVDAVHYPGLDEHPGHQIAARQMEMFGGMISVQVKGGREEAMAVAAKVELFTPLRLDMTQYSAVKTLQAWERPLKRLFPKK